MKTRYNYLFIVFSLCITLLVGYFYLSVKNFYNKKQYESLAMSSRSPRRGIASEESSNKNPEKMYAQVSGFYESYKYAEFLDAVNDMVKDYPQDPHTGLALLKMYKYLKANDMNKEASFVLKKVKTNFGKASPESSLVRAPVASLATTAAVSETSQPTREISSENKKDKPKQKINKYEKLYRKKYLDLDQSVDY